MWAKQSLDVRITAVLRFLNALKAMNDEVVLELAMQMGPLVRYGGDIKGVEERVLAMAAHAPRCVQPETASFRGFQGAKHAKFFNCCLESFSS